MDSEDESDDELIDTEPRDIIPKFGVNRDLSGFTETSLDPADFASGNGHAFTKDRMSAFLKLLAQYGTIKTAALAVNISHSTVRTKRDNDSAFDDACKEMLEVYHDSIRNAIHRRAIDGVPKILYFQGVPCGVELVTSDRLLELHAKAHLKEYRDQVSIDATVKAGVMVVGAGQMSVDDWANMDKDGAPKEVIPDRAEPAE